MESCIAHGWTEAVGGSVDVIDVTVTSTTSAETGLEGQTNGAAVPCGPAKHGS